MTLGARLDIVMPVFNEGENIVPVLEALVAAVRTPFRVLVCYDFDGDTTLTALAAAGSLGCDVTLVKNPIRGAHGAVLAGFAHSTASAVLVFPADDDYNGPRLDAMVEQFERGNDIVAASRFMRGGSMVGCPWLKAAIIRVSAWALHRLAGIPTHDPSNGFRLFSRRVIDRILIESSEGFVYSIELLVKCHRLRWPIAEVPVDWRERVRGQSRFRVLRWLPAYLRWFWYAFATTYLRRGPGSVPLRGNA